MIDRILGTLRGRGGAIRPEAVRLLWDAGLLRLDSPRTAARALPHLAARGMHLGLAFQIHGRDRRDEPALVDGRGPMTWGRLDDRAVRLGRALRRRGVMPGDRVVSLLPGDRELVEVVAATQKAAAWLAVVDPSLAAEELRTALVDEFPKVLVYDADRAGPVRDAMRGMVPPPRLIATGPGEPLGGSSSYEDVLAAADDHDFRPNPVPQPGLRFYLPGADAPVERDVERLLKAGIGLLRDLRLKREDVVVVAAPPSDPVVMDLLAVLLMLGCTVVLAPPDDPRAILNAIHDGRATVTVMSAAAAAAAVALPASEARGFDRSRLQYAILLGAPLDDALLGRAANLLGPVVHTLFSSPSAGWVALSAPPDREQRRGTVGRVITGVRMSVRDDRGEPLALGETGELWVASDLTIRDGEDPGRERPVGASGRLDEDGYVHLVQEEPA